MRAHEFTGDYAIHLRNTLNETIGPHEGRELELMLAGTKPAAIVFANELNQFKPYIKSGEFVIASRIPHKQYSSWTSYVITRPEESWRGDAIKGIMENMAAAAAARASTGEEIPPALHVRFGLLLGYSADDIIHFLSNYYSIDRQEASRLYRQYSA